MNERPENRSEMVCPQCGSKRSSASQFCKACGHCNKPECLFEQSADIQRERQIDPIVFHPDTPLGMDRFGETAAIDLVYAVGKKENYYMPIFETVCRFKKSGKFHIFAFLFGGAWMLYRKQYLRGSIILGIQLLLQAVAAVANVLYTLPIIESIFADPQITAIPDTMTEEKLAAVLRIFSDFPLSQRLVCLFPIILQVAGLIFAVVIGFNANRWYFRHLVALVKKADLPPQKTRREKKEFLHRNGGVNLPLVICLAVCFMLFSHYFSIFLALLAM